jgi:neurotransmitter:Na+ symporter, NSS family
MVLTLGVVAMGVEKGLERAVKFLMPALFILLLVLVGYGATTGHLGQAASFLFKPDFSEVTGAVFLQAMGQAFFSLSLGMCAMMTYGAYLPTASRSRRSAAWWCWPTPAWRCWRAGDLPDRHPSVTRPAGGGPGLIFTSLPLAFNAMSFGIVYGLLFFGLLSMAAWTSSISLLEPATAYIVEATNLHHTRRAGQEDARLGLQRLAVADPNRDSGADPGGAGQPVRVYLINRGHQRPTRRREG